MRYIMLSFLENDYLEFSWNEIDDELTERVE